jgi:stage V sporulation protein S
MLKVSSVSRPESVAGAIAAHLGITPTIEVRAIGAGAVNQAVKAVAIARDYLEKSGLDLVCVPRLCVVDIEGHERTAVVLEVRTA